MYHQEYMSQVFSYTVFPSILVKKAMNMQPSLKEINSPSSINVKTLTNNFKTRLPLILLALVFLHYFVIVTTDTSQNNRTNNINSFALWNLVGIVDFNEKRKQETRPYGEEKVY